MKSFRMTMWPAVMVFALILATGCAGPGAGRSASGPGEICHVCEYNNDLACVCVHVTSDTPRADYESRTYYFCSEDCKTAFLKKPKKYLPR